MLNGGRLAVFSSSGEFTGTVGDTPPAAPGVPAQVAGHAYQSTARLSPDRTRLALVTRHADRLEIYRADGTLAARATGPRGFEPVYSVARNPRGEPIFGSGRDLRFGYVDVAATEERIYALYSGRTRGQAPGRANFGRWVHVYDWSGRLHEVLGLDSDVLGIAVSADGGTLYAVRHEPAPALVAYPLADPSARTAAR
jgi:TolB-like 6-blade propeller-like